MIVFDLEPANILSAMVFPSGALLSPIEIGDGKWSFPDAVLEMEWYSDAHQLIRTWKEENNETAIN